MEKKVSETKKKIFNLAVVIKKEWRRNMKKKGKLQHLKMHSSNKKCNC